MNSDKQGVSVALGDEERPAPVSDERPKRPWFLAYRTTGLDIRFGIFFLILGAIRIWTFDDAGERLGWWADAITLVALVGMTAMCAASYLWLRRHPSYVPLVKRDS